MQHSAASLAPSFLARACTATQVACPLCDSSRELPAATAPKGKRHQPHRGVAAGDGRWNKRRGTKGKHNRGRRNPETVKRKAEERRQLAEYNEYQRERTITPSSPSPASTEVPSDNEQQLAAHRVKAEQGVKTEKGAKHRSHCKCRRCTSTIFTALVLDGAKREKKEEVEEDDTREHGLKDVEFTEEPQSSNPTAASSRIQFTQYVASQEEKATSKWEKVYLAKREGLPCFGHVTVEKPERK